MALDYSKMSDADLAALAKNDYKTMSDAGLALVAAGETPAPALGQAAKAQTGAGVGMGTTPLPASAPRLSKAAELAKMQREEAANTEVLGSKFLGRNLASMAGSVTQTGQGLHGLVADAVNAISPNTMEGPDPENVAREKALASEGTTGNVVGNILQSAVPGGAVTKVLGGAKLAAGAGGLARAADWARKVIAAPAGAAGLQSAATSTPDEGESRLGNAAEASAWGGGLGAAGRGLSRTLTGLVKPNMTEAGKTAIRAGAPGLGTGDPRIVPTVAGATEGGMGTVVGGAQKIWDLLSGKPNRFGKEIIDQTVRESVPYPSKMIAKPGSTQGWAAEGQAQYDKAYKSLLGNRDVPLDVTHKDALVTDVQNYLAGTHPAGPTGAVGTPTDIGKVTWKVTQAWNKAEQNIRERGGSSAELYQEFRNQLSAAQRGLKGEQADVMGEALNLATKRLDSFAEAHLGPDVMQNLADLHQRNVGFHIIKEAIAKTKSSLPLTAQELLNEAHLSAPKGLAINAGGKFQGLTKAAQSILDREGTMGTIPKRAAYLTAGAATMGIPMLSGLGMAGLPVLAGALGAGALARTKGGAEFLMGMKPSQEKLAQLLRSPSGLKEKILSNAAAGIAPTLAGSSDQR